MGILYALVGRGSVVLAEFSGTTTNASAIARQILEKIPGNNDTHVSYSQDRYIFHVKRTDGLTVLCMADDTAGRRIPFAFLEDIHQKFVRTYGRAVHSAQPYGMNEEFSRVLSQQMEYYSSDPNADRINRLKGEMSQVRNVMIENIDKVLDRGDRLELLVDKTANMQGNTFRFRKQARRFRSTVWWRNVKLTYVIVYFAILYIRHHAGIVTDEMLDTPKAPFIVVGLLEALAAATGMAAGVLTMYSINNDADAGGGAGAGNSLKEGGNNLFGFIPKTEGTIRMPSSSLLVKIMGHPLSQLPNYLKDGAACFLDVGTLTSGCDGAPLLPLLFIIVNIGFNIALLHLLKISSAVVSCLASTFSASYGTGASAAAEGDRPREILVQHLLVKEDDQKLLLDIQQRISSGEDLSDLAVEYSLCPSKEEGGMLGWVRKGQMAVLPLSDEEADEVPEFEEAAFTAPLNKVVSCKTKFGWHLLQVLSEREESILQDIQPDELHVKIQDPSFFDGAQLIDVREPEEVAKASLPGFTVLPLRQFGSWGPEITTKFDPQKDTYVLCHHGMRSLQVAKWLQSQGFRKVYNLSGGIHAYAVQVDPSVPTY
ncbi:hypothetical protein JHK85_005773 [Glycine max]|nr:hypothetical protein JHK85_005773 [Glycine max]KAG5081549.1 hypothetical protein JHK86_005614 [Glycine max]